MKDRSTAPTSPLDAAAVARLEAHLVEQAASMRLPDPPVGTVVARAAQRRVNRRASLGALSAAALVGAVLIAAQALTTEDGRRTVVITDETPVTETPAPTTTIESTTTVESTTGIEPETRQVPSTLSWTTADPDPESDAALAAVYDNIGGTGPLVSWTYQEQPPPDHVSNLYISTDGIDWRPPATSPNLSITDATAAGSRIAVLGFTPTSVPVEEGDLVVAVSNDTGATWQYVPLPLPMRWLRDQPGVRMVRPTYTSSVVFDGDTIVAVAGIEVYLDPMTLLSEDLRNDEVSPQLTDTGFDLHWPPMCLDDPQVMAETGQPCATFSEERIVPVTFAELGIAPEVVDAARSNGLQFFVSDNGEPFRRATTSPLPDPRHYRDVNVIAADGEFTALLSTPSFSLPPQSTPLEESVLWRSGDGDEWVELGSVPVQGGHDATFGKLNDSYVVNGRPTAAAANSLSAPPVVYFSTDGAHWRQQDFAGLLAVRDDAPAGTTSGLIPFGSAVVGPDGFTAVALMPVDPVTNVGGVRITRNDVTMHTRAMFDDHAFYDANTGELLGELLGDAPFDDGVIRTTGKGVIEVLHPDGSVRATFNLEDITAPTEEAQAVATPHQRFFVHSPDGVEWSAVQLGEIVGDLEPFLSHVQTIDGRTVLVTHLLGPNGETDYKALIGTSPPG